MSAIAAKRFTLEEYHRLAELGFFQDHRVELIRGEIFQMSAKGKVHATLNRRLIRELSKLLGDRATLQSQDPITIATNSQPEPDITIIQNRDDDYFNAHPNPSDVLLLIEISDSSLSYDQEVKLPLYAEASISDYWIFNLQSSCLECYSEPYQDLQKQFGYRQKLIFLPNESVKPPYFSDLVLDLSKVFPNENN